MFGRKRKLLDELKVILYVLYTKCTEADKLIGQGAPIQAFTGLYTFVVSRQMSNLEKLDEFLTACQKVKFGKLVFIYRQAYELKRRLREVEENDLIERLIGRSWRIRLDIENPEFIASYLCGKFSPQIMQLIATIIDDAKY
jgi:hypothetical protein